MRYAILRTAKIKSTPGLVRAVQHDCRDHTPPNADPTRAKDNTISGTFNEAMARFRRQTDGVRMRRDSVVGIEYLVTASPEVMLTKNRQEQDAYFNASLDWIIGRHGKENILSYGIHRDEKTPHLHVVVVPVVMSRDRWGREGRSLSAKTFLGGAEKLKAMQTEFASAVGKRHGLIRGVEGSRAKHTTVRQFYGALNPENQIERSYELPRKGKPEEVEKIILDDITPGIKALQQKALTCKEDREARTSMAEQLAAEREKSAKFEKWLLEMPIEKILEARKQLRPQEQARERATPKKDRGLER